MDDTPLKESDEVSISEEPDYRYGPQVRVIKNHKEEAKIEAENLDDNILTVYQHTPRWALEAVHQDGYTTVYIHEPDTEIESYEDLLSTVDNHYNS